MNMSHFAKIENGLVTQVIVAEQQDVATLEGTWIQTSYNTIGNQHKLGGTPLRKNYDGIGYSYDEQRNAFIPPKPFPSWLLNEETCLWDSPVPYPTDDKRYSWDEAITSWVENDPL